MLGWLSGLAVARLQLEVGVALLLLAPLQVLQETRSLAQ